jgi:Uma2 family endonuclease
MADAPVHTLDADSSLDRSLWPEASLDDVPIEDGKPVDNLFSEREMRLLVDSLYVSWPGPADGRNFVAMANVGMFYAQGEPPLVPDVLLSLGVKLGDLSRKEHNTYFSWVMGKHPDVTIEIVSNKEGGEGDVKLEAYARLGISYYIIHDPLNKLGQGKLRVYGSHEGKYRLLDKPWLQTIGLGLTLWRGEFEGVEEEWLRWQDRDGNVLLSGKEAAARLAQRAEQETQRAEQERQRAEQERQRAERLAEQLRQLGVDPKG